MTTEDKMKREMMKPLTKVINHPDDHYEKKNTRHPKAFFITEDHIKNIMVRHIIKASKVGPKYLRAKNEEEELKQNFKNRMQAYEDAYVANRR